MVINIFSLKKV